MRKNKIILVLLSAVQIILELLPFGVVMNFAKVPEEGGGVYRQTYSYFSLLPFGYANFFPLIIAVLSCATLCLSLVYTFTGKILGAIQIISMAVVILSLSPIVYGISYFSVVGIAIAVVAFTQTVWSFAIRQTDKQA